MKRFRIVTLGCKVNQYESAALAGQMERRGWVPAAADKTADLVIVNTCTVTGKAAMQSRQALRHAVKTSAGARIVATGCYAQTAAAELETIEGIHYIVGHSDKYRIPELVLDVGPEPSSPPVQICGDVSGPLAFESPRAAAVGSRTRQFLKIQDGCNSFCTYCIVPYARGRSRSMPWQTVLDHLDQLDAAGYKEVVLTGIHLGYYGLDLSPKTSLLALLQRIAEHRPLARIRISSIEPNELTEAIIDLVAASDVFCPHFHMPLQSGDDTILQRMHRPYTGAFFTQRVRYIHRRMPEAAVGVDILAGFPGETDGSFDRTYSVIQALDVSYLHVFPFSPRPGTPAECFPKQVPAAAIRARCSRMRRLGEAKKRRFYTRFIGKTLDVLVEENRDARTGRLKGFGENYVPVLFDGTDALKNARIAVRITDFGPGLTVSGTPLSARICR